MTINNKFKARLHLPVQTAGSKLFPVGVFGHSGGFCEGGLNSEDTFCRIIAHRYTCIIVSIDYRKAPVCKLPAEFEDFLDGVLWVSNIVVLFAKCGTRN